MLAPPRSIKRAFLLEIPRAFSREFMPSATSEASFSPLIISSSMPSWFLICAKKSGAFFALLNAAVAAPKYSPLSSCSLFSSLRAFRILSFA